VTSVDARPRPGRRRDPACDRAILDAALATFVAHGYRGMSIEGVASRAGVGKATIYRRYASKAELLVDAMRRQLLLVDELPDTGDLRADLLAMYEPLVELLRGRDGPLLVAFMTERFREPDLAAEFERSVVGGKRVHVRKLVNDAIARGQLPASTDVDLFAQLAPALIWHQALNNHPIDRDLVERIVDQILPGKSRKRRSAQ
jgi:AcrR family transcriptional regulator